MEREGYMKNYFKHELESYLDTIPEKYDQSNCWLCEEKFIYEDVKENPVVEDYCHLTGKFRGLAHDN